MTPTQWQAIQTNNKAFDDVFWYAVKSTKIVCRPSCPSRVPKKENITIFYQVEEALAACYRPCKRCRPLNEPVTNQAWVRDMTAILETHYQEPLTLAEMAQLVHGSASYLRHVYKAETGQTLMQALEVIRMKHAKKHLVETTKSVAQIAQEVGMPTTSYFIKKFQQHVGLSPLKYRQSKLQEATHLEES